MVQNNQIIVLLVGVFDILAISTPAFGLCPPDCAPKASYTTGLVSGSNATSVTLGSSPSQITVTTDKPSYNYGDTITISGTTRDYISGTPISITITNSTGSVVYITQVILGTDKTYSTTLTPSGSLWKNAGTYTIYVQFGSPDRSTTTTFNFNSNGNAIPPSSSPTQPTTPTAVPSTPATPSKIPSWVRNIFIWYGQGQVSEDELLSALKFLIQQGIIKVS